MTSPIDARRVRSARHEGDKMDLRFWFLATLIMTALLWIPYVLDRIARLGLARTFANPTPADAANQSAWALRAKAAHANAVENLAVFAPLALVALSGSAAATQLAVAASAVYFFARLSHYLFYTAGVPVARTLAFFAGVGAQVALLVAVAKAGCAP
jgi:uncharacterized MAPEG superfamily protein